MPDLGGRLWRIHLPALVTGVLLDGDFSVGPDWVDTIGPAARHQTHLLGSRLTTLINRIEKRAELQHRVTAQKYMSIQDGANKNADAAC